MLLGYGFTLAASFWLAYELVYDFAPHGVSALRFWRELGVTTLEELKVAAEQERVRTLPGLGAKAEERILKALELGEIPGHLLLIAVHPVQVVELKPGGGQLRVQRGRRRSSTRWGTSAGDTRTLL